MTKDVEFLSMEIQVKLFTKSFSSILFLLAH